MFPLNYSGKIADIKVTTEGQTKTATVTFEKETASKTALLLDHTKLGENEINVSSPVGATADDGAQPKHQAERDSDEITQEEKPRARILAEYLAHGYVVADAGLNTAIALDEKHGVSSRFLKTIQGLDEKYHATDRAKTADKSYGISSRATHLFNGLGSYFEKAGNTPTGKRIVKFYTDSSRQASDIHNEARRLADLKTQEHGGSPYKAAGLDRVFGPEKTTPPAGGAAAGGQGEAAPGISAPATVPGAPSTQVPAAASQETTTAVPKFDPPPTA